MSEETLFKTFLIPASLFCGWFVFALYGFIKKVLKGYKFKQKDIRAIRKAIGVLLLICLGVWVLLILGTLLVGKLMGVDV